MGLKLEYLFDTYTYTYIYNIWVIVICKKSRIIVGGIKQICNLIFFFFLMVSHIYIDIPIIVIADIVKFNLHKYTKCTQCIYSSY